MEKLSKEQKEEIEYILNKETCFWDLLETFNNRKSREVVLNPLLGELQTSILRKILQSIDGALDFHNGEDSEAHTDIRSKADKLDARLRNHRHETGRTWSGKAEY